MGEGEEADSGGWRRDSTSALTGVTADTGEGGEGEGGLLIAGEGRGTAERSFS